MAIFDYEYETSPRKYQPEPPRRNRQKDLAEQKRKEEEQRRKNEEQRRNAIRLEKKKHNENVMLVLAIFLILLTVSYRSSLINERFNGIQNQKNELAAIEKTNGQLRVSIEGGLNLGNIEQQATEQLGMQKLNNDQKVYVTLSKKDYIETSSEKINIATDTDIPWYKKIVNKILGK